MGSSFEPLVIAATEIAIESSCQQIPKGSGIEGGVVCTGFIDIEKILRRTHCHRGKHIVTNFFLEKKLPFQVLLIAFEGYVCDGSGWEDWSDSSDSGTSSGSDADCESGEETDGDHESDEERDSHSGSDFLADTDGGGESSGSRDSAE